MRSGDRYEVTDDERARMTLRYVLCNDALTAAINSLGAGGGTPMSPALYQARHALLVDGVGKAAGFGFGSRERAVAGVGVFAGGENNHKAG